MKPIIVTNKPWFTDYVLEYILPDENNVPVIEHATSEDVEGKHIYSNGSIPFYLGVSAGIVTVIRVPVPHAKRDLYLDPEEVAEFAREPKTYRVTAVEAKTITRRYEMSIEDGGQAFPVALTDQ